MRLFDKIFTYFDANSVHFLSHVHSGMSVMQLWRQNKFREILFNPLFKLKVEDFFKFRFLV